jgi:hypothetical protein
MELRVGLLVLVTHLSVATANADMSELYSLPPSKVYIESCQREALLIHPGFVEQQRILQKNGDFWVRYQILSKDGSESVVLCDLANGKIAGEQKLIDGTF